MQPAVPTREELRQYLAAVARCELRVIVAVLRTTPPLVEQAIVRGDRVVELVSYFVNAGRVDFRVRVDEHGRYPTARGSPMLEHVLTRELDARYDPNHGDELDPETTYQLLVRRHLAVKDAAAAHERARQQVRDRLVTLHTRMLTAARVTLGSRLDLVDESEWSQPLAATLSLVPPAQNEREGERECRVAQALVVRVLVEGFDSHADPKETGPRRPETDLACAVLALRAAYSRYSTALSSL
jgi:hypothetical protein